MAESTGTRYCDDDCRRAVANSDTPKLPPSCRRRIPGARHSASVSVSTALHGDCMWRGKPRCLHKLRPMFRHTLDVGTRRRNGKDLARARTIGPSGTIGAEGGPRLTDAPLFAARAAEIRADRLTAFNHVFDSNEASLSAARTRRLGIGHGGFLARWLRHSEDISAREAQIHRGDRRFASPHGVRPVAIRAMRRRIDGLSHFPHVIGRSGSVRYLSAARRREQPEGCASTWTREEVDLKPGRRRQSAQLKRRRRER